MLKLRDSQLAMATMVTIAVLWGSSAVVTKGLLAHMAAPNLLAVRFVIAAIALVAVSPRALRMSRRTLVDGLVMGALFAAAQLTQTIGLGRTSASVSGFLTGLYVVATPLLSWALTRRRLGRTMWVSVGLATIGLAAFTVLPSGDGPAGFGWGETLTLVSAVLFAAHMLATGRRVTASTSMSLTIVQTYVVAVASLLLQAPHGITLPQGGDWVPLLYVGVVCGAVCMFGQIWAQAHIDPVRAAVVMCSEPLWTALFAMLFAGEVLTLPVLVGGLCIVGAMVVVVVPSRLLAPMLVRLRRREFTPAA